MCVRRPMTLALMTYWPCESAPVAQAGQRRHGRYREADDGDDNVAQQVAQRWGLSLARKVSVMSAGV